MVWSPVSHLQPCRVQSVSPERKLIHFKMTGWLVLVMLGMMGTSMVQAQVKNQVKTQVKTQVKSVSVWNTKKYPICLGDSDCDSISKKARLDHHLPNIVCQGLGGNNNETV